MVITETPEQCQNDPDARAEQYLSVASNAAKAAGIPYEGIHVMHDHPYEASLPRHRRGVASHCHGLARSQRDVRTSPGERDRKGSNSQQHSGSGVALTYDC
jgi:hypothetical protein